MRSPCDRNMAALYRGRAEVELARQDPTPAQRARALSDLEQAIRLEPPGNPVLARDHTNRARLLHRAQRRRAGAGGLRGRLEGRPRLCRRPPPADRGAAGT